MLPVYFRYGPLMDEAEMLNLCPGAQSLGEARLYGYRMVFVMGPAGYVVPRMVPAEDTEDFVQGRLWGNTSQGFNMNVAVERPDGSMFQCVTHSHNDCNDAARPDIHVLGPMCRGYRQLGLDPLPMLVSGDALLVLHGHVEGAQLVECTEQATVWLVTPGQADRLVEEHGMYRPILLRPGIWVWGW